MSTPSKLKPRPTREAGAQSRREREARKRTAAKRQQRIVLGVSFIALIIAVVVVVKSLTQSSTSNDIAAGNLHPFVGKTQNGMLVPGTTIDSIQCGGTEQLAYHIHAHLDVFIDGQPQEIPAYIGILFNKDGSSKCLYWVHVHDTSGVIHIEAPAQAAPTFGSFLDIWSATPAGGGSLPVVSHSVLNTILTRKPDVVAVNGKAYGGDLRKIPLSVHTLISISYGSKSVTQQPYDFSLVDPGSN